MPILYVTIINIPGTNLRPQHNLMATFRNAILALLSCILPVLFHLIGLKFKNESISVFEAHPITTKVAIAALLLFALSFGLQFSWEEYFAYLCPTPAALLLNTMVFSGSLLLASLASILFPDECRPLIYLIYLFLSLGNYLYMLVRKGCEWVQGIMDKLQTSFTRMRLGHLTRNRAILPLTNMDTRYRVNV